MCGRRRHKMSPSSLGCHALVSVGHWAVVLLAESEPQDRLARLLEDVAPVAWDAALAPFGQTVLPARSRTHLSRWFERLRWLGAGCSFLPTGSRPFVSPLVRRAGVDRNGCLLAGHPAPPCSFGVSMPPPSPPIRDDYHGHRVPLDSRGGPFNLPHTGPSQFVCNLPQALQFSWFRFLLPSSQRRCMVRACSSKPNLFPRDMHWFLSLSKV